MLVIIFSFMLKMKTLQFDSAVALIESERPA